MHVKQIREIVSEGKTEEAHAALDQLLELGPQNTEALKLRAKLHEFEGRFSDEARVWDRVATIDREDPDAITFLLRRQLEDREHFYFTDDLPGGGRRFMAYPRALVNTSVLGLIGCVTFLLTTRLSTVLPIIGEATVMLGLFGVLVMGPWIAIIATYVRSIKALLIGQDGLTVQTRVKSRHFAWRDIERAVLSRSGDGEAAGGLALVLIPRDKQGPALELDLAPGSSAVRARSYLIREVARQFGEPHYAARATLGLDTLNVYKY